MDSSINKGGRPAKFEDLSTLQLKIDEYFESGVELREFVVGGGTNRQIINVKIPTISGLCYYLGFESRQSFYDLENKEGFSYTIKKARLKIERLYEEQLQYGNTTGAIFALKNMGWADKQEIDHTSKGEKITMSDDEFNERLKKAQKILNVKP